MNVRFLAFGLSTILLGVVLALFRREKLTFKYAFGWMLLLILAIGLSLFEKYLFGLSRFLGFELPSNFIFFTCLGALVSLSLLMTMFLCQQNERNDRIAQKLALLEEEMKQLRK